MENTEITNILLIILGLIGIFFLPAIIKFLIDPQKSKADWKRLAQERKGNKHAK